MDLFVQTPSFMLIMVYVDFIMYRWLKAAKYLDTKITSVCSLKK